jgi:type 1 fimbria pilin
MSASMMIMALALGASTDLPRPSGTGTVQVSGFVPASCHVTASASVGCSGPAVKSVAVASPGAPAIVSVSPLF